jgi:hypothetical protein
MKPKLEVVGSHSDSMSVLCYGLDDDGFFFSGISVASLALHRNFVNDSDEAPIWSNEDKVEFGAWRWIPTADGEYCRWLVIACESESAYGQFFATVWYPRRWKEVSDGI